MYLSDLLRNIISLPPHADCLIDHLVLDSRQIKKGCLFFAVPGGAHDGRQYIDQAIALGVKAVLLDGGSSELIEIKAEVPIISIPQLKSKIAFIAARFYNDPAHKLYLLGVTGTSGKTSCTQFFAQILQLEEHIPCGIIGTLGNGFYGALEASSLTTPDALSLQSLLHGFVEQKAEVAAIEVSSHSIDQGRVNDIPFDIGMFTNLSQDHLDYHQSMEAYAAVKRRFLTEFPIKHLVINADDNYGQTWLNELITHPSLFAYCTQKETNEKINKKIPRLYTEQVSLSASGIKALVHTPWGSDELFMPLMGRFNLSNGLAVLTALCLYGIPFSKAIAHLAVLRPVPGRMQVLGGQNKPLVIVDYAHKPDALEKVLQALRLHTQGKLYCVFGCGGERDRGKRPLMANIAETWADHVIVTNDNPRHEKPEAILADIMQGFLYPERILVELDRSKAIRNGIQWAKAKDCVLIAGKGAEHYQQMGDEKIPFDDVEQVLKYL